MLKFNALYFYNPREIKTSRSRVPWKNYLRPRFPLIHRINLRSPPYMTKANRSSSLSSTLSPPLRFLATFCLCRSSSTYLYQPFIFHEKAYIDGEVDHNWSLSLSEKAYIHGNWSFKLKNRGGSEKELWVQSTKGGLELLNVRRVILKSSQRHSKNHLILTIIFPNL